MPSAPTHTRGDGTRVRARSTHMPRRGQPLDRAGMRAAPAAVLPSSTARRSARGSATGGPSPSQATDAREAQRPAPSIRRAHRPDRRARVPRRPRALSGSPELPELRGERRRALRERLQVPGVSLVWPRVARLEGIALLRAEIAVDAREDVGTVVLLVVERKAHKLRQ